MRFHHRVGKTMLSVQDMALIFRDNLGRAAGLWRASAALMEWDFYTPEPSRDPCQRQLKIDTLSATEF